MFLLGLLLNVPNLAYAEPPAVVVPAEAPVLVDVTLVLASDNGVVDPELADLADLLTRLRYTGFTKVRAESSRLSGGETLRVALLDGQVLSIRLIDHDERSARLRLRRLRGDQVLADTTINVHRDQPLVAGGQRVADGQLLHPITVSW